jgi:membrane protein YqaA with SNARE-associated domain
MWLLVALLVATGSAVFPPISIEFFVIGFGLEHPHLPYLAFGAVIAVGQVAGKLLYFYAGRGSIRLPAFLHRRTTDAADAPARPPSWRRPWRVLTGSRLWRGGAAWLRTKWAWLREKCERHPKWMVGATVTSSLIGLPPLIATTVLAGLAGLSLRTFVLASFPGRFVRFSALAASPMMVHHWMHAVHSF